MLALCRFEESLGSSDVGVSMATEGFPRYFESARSRALKYSLVSEGVRACFLAHAD